MLGFLGEDARSCAPLGVHWLNDGDSHREYFAEQEAQMVELTPKTQKKMEKLIEITERNLPTVKRKLRKRNLPDSPFSESVAKYYPALKKLAKE